MKTKSPGNKPLSKHIKCLNPGQIVEDPDFAAECFSEMCAVFKNCDLLKTEEIDALVQDYERFIRTCRKDKAFVSFDIDNGDHRLDELFYAALSDKPQYKNLWEKVVGKALVLSHGQATVERGFSQNKEVTETNQVAESLIARRSITDHMNFVGGRSKVVITDPLIKKVRTANQRYRQMLRDQQRKKEPEGKKRKLMQDEIDQIRKKRKELDALIKKLDNEGRDIIAKCHANDAVEMSKVKGLFARVEEEREKLESLDDELQTKTALFNNS